MYVTTGNATVLKELFVIDSPFTPLSTKQAPNQIKAYQTIK